MRKSAVSLLIGALTACSTGQHSEVEYLGYDAPPSQEIKSGDLPTHAISQVAKGLAYELVKSNDYATARTPVAVTSFVNLDNLEETNWLGNQLAEGFVHELHLHGLTVVDYKSTGSIRVTRKGDFALSRDWKELPGRQVIDYVVTGTMTPQDDGIIVNARMVGMQSHVVVATSQAFIPSWVFGGRIEMLQQVKMKDGMIIRDAKALAKEKRAIKIHQ